MKNLISGLLMKPKTDMGVATKGKSRTQPIKGEMKPRRARNPRPRHGLKIEDELAIVNSDKSGNESNIADSVRVFD